MQYYVTVVGDEGVGKSFFVERFHSVVFRSDIPYTIGVDITTHNVTIDDRNHKIYLWDTAGKERFRDLITGYLREAQGFFVLYSVADETSFDNFCLAGLT